MNAGTVLLVGAGPGDPGLMTLKGVQCIRSADVVVYDRLVDRRLLTHARPDAELIDVGKVPGAGAGRQEEINRLLVDRAKRGGRVVRLKGGDPFVFGRGGEEAEALQAAGVSFDVVPGVTSAIAAPAYAGIPITHRAVASSFTVVTGNESPEKESPAVDWDHLARQSGTLVVLMGWDNLAAIVRTLVRNGRPLAYPVALVHWGTEPHQRTVVGTLADIVDRAASAGLTPPVVAVFGEVVGLRDRLRWFDRRPLFGKRALVTRTRAQAGALSALLSERGAQAIELPTIEIRPPDDYAGVDRALRDMRTYDWVVFTSGNAITAVFDRLHALGLDARAFGASRLGAIGPATAECLRERGLVADFVPEQYVVEAVVEGLRSLGCEGSRVLLPRGDLAREALPRGLSAAGASVDEVTVYRTATPEGSEACAGRVLSEGVDVATFTSSSTVRNLAGLLGGSLDALSKATIACIGPITASAARGLGLRVDIIASRYTVEGLVEALEEYFTEEALTHE